jgi:uncharacterized protein
LEDDFSTQGFYGNLASGQLLVLRCRSCKNYVMPPTSICEKCLSTDLNWTQVNQEGRIVSFSEIFVSNRAFHDRTPYVASIIETNEGIRLPGIIKNKSAKDLKVGDLVYISISSEGNSKNYYFVLKKP